MHAASVNTFNTPSDVDRGVVVSTRFSVQHTKEKTLRVYEGDIVEYT